VIFSPRSSILMPTNRNFRKPGPRLSDIEILGDLLGLIIPWTRLVKIAERIQVATLSYSQGLNQAYSVYKEE
jgi:hypothetical protein